MTTTHERTRQSGLSTTVGLTLVTKCCFNVELDCSAQGVVILGDTLEQPFFGNHWATRTAVGRCNDATAAAKQLAKLASVTVGVYVVDCRLDPRACQRHPGIEQRTLQGDSPVRPRWPESRAEVAAAVALQSLGFPRVPADLRRSLGTATRSIGLLDQAA